MQITITVTKDGEDGKFKAKFRTSKGDSNVKIRDAEFSEIADKLVKILEEANTDGYIGKK